MAKSSSLMNFRNCIAKTVRKRMEKSVAAGVQGCRPLDASFNVTVELDSPQVRLRHLHKNGSIHVL